MDGDSEVELGGISFKISFDDEFVNEVGRIVKAKLERDPSFLAPRTVVDTAPEAYFIEFGSGPSKYFSKSHSKDDRRTDIHREKVEYNGKTYFMTPTEKKFFEWAKMKGARDPIKLGHNVYRKVMEHGMPPQPFLRPAAFRVRNDPELAKVILTEGTQGVAERIVEQARKNLESSTAGPSSDIWRKLEIVEAGNTEAISINAGTMDDSKWVRPGSGEFDWPDRYGVHRAVRYVRKG